MRLTIKNKAPGAPSGKNAILGTIKHIIEIEKNMVRDFFGLSAIRPLFGDSYSLDDNDVTLDEKINITLNRYLDASFVGCDSGSCSVDLSGDYLSALNLMINLNKSLATRIYSYAVTPKEKAQRYIGQSSNHHQSELVSSLIADADTEIALSKLELLTKLHTDTLRVARAMQRQPKVLGFASNQQKIMDDETPYTHFGWLIGPSANIKNDSKLKQKPVYHALSAVVSLPSWWTTVSAKITTCWLAKPKNKILQEKQAFALDQLEVPSWLLSILPGTSNEIERKLGYTIRRVPFVEFVSNKQHFGELYVGQNQAKILIKGKELWRSTVVTLGSQRSNKIEVLPDMNGIIATFDIIDIPSNLSRANELKRGACTVDVDLIVWTSEGSTDPYPVTLYITHPNVVGNINMRYFCPNIIQTKPDNIGNENEAIKRLNQLKVIHALKVHRRVRSRPDPLRKRNIEQRIQLIQYSELARASVRLILSGRPLVAWCRWRWILKRAYSLHD